MAVRKAVNVVLYPADGLGAVGGLGLWRSSRGYGLSGGLLCGGLPVTGQNPQKELATGSHLSESAVEGFQPHQRSDAYRPPPSETENHR
jgi:hypothetical protein